MHGVSLEHTAKYRRKTIPMKRTPVFSMLTALATLTPV
jgi:hypothetical protein